MAATPPAPPKHNPWRVAYIALILIGVVWGADYVRQTVERWGLAPIVRKDTDWPTKPKGPVLGSNINGPRTGVAGCLANHAPNVPYQCAKTPINPRGVCVCTP